MMVKFFVFFSGAVLLLTTPLSAYNEEHLARLHRRVQKGISIRCKGFDLQDADLSGLNLKKADFSGANLQGAIFTKAQLQKANFSRSNLSEADFEHANLNGANFTLANLTLADFTRASANGAKFRGAKLLDAHYTDIFSAKGSLLGDKANLSKKLGGEEEVDTKATHAKFPQKRKATKALDLHGKVSLGKKKKQIDKFVEESYWHSRGTIEIITGRGLHNPDGKMGILWRLCKDYLSSGEFKNYIQAIHPTSENGGWRLSLKPYTYNRSKNKPSAKVQFISPPQTKPSFSAKKKSAAPAPRLQKKVPLPIVNRPVIRKAPTPNKNKSYAEVSGAKKVPSPVPPKAKKAVPSPVSAAKKAKGSNPPKTSKKKKPSAVKKGPAQPKG
jgi:hypothetical protein